MTNYKIRLTFWLSLFLAFTSTSAYPAADFMQARYIRILLPGYTRILSLAEVQVLARGSNTNIAVSGSAIQSTTQFNASASRAIDGKTNGAFSSQSVTHTLTERNPWWELDLTKEYPIAAIKLFNRTDCCTERLLAARVLLLNSARDPVWATTISDVQSSYAINTRDSTNLIGQFSPNLLRNADFRVSTDGFMPDNWDIHPSAKLRFQNLENIVGYSNETPLEVTNVKSIRISNPDPNFWFTMFQSQQQFSVLPPGSYTFSVYLKAENGGGAYLLSDTDRATFSPRVTLSSTWKQYTATYTLAKPGEIGLNPTIRFDTAGTYYIAAPQLEYGSTATPFQTAYEDQSPLPNYNRAPPPSDLRSVYDSASGTTVTTATDYNAYASGEPVQLRLTNFGSNSLQVTVQCTSITQSPPQDVMTALWYLEGRGQKIFEIPLTVLSPGSYQCATRNSLQDSLLSSATFTVLPKRDGFVRVNRFKNFIEIDGRPFQVRGITFGSEIPPNWYLSDLVAAGINTIIYWVPYRSSGVVDLDAVENLLGAAKTYGFKVLLASPVAGKMPRNLQQLIDGYAQVVARYREHPAILGWYLVDEPDVPYWQASELQRFYARVKSLDPYHIAFHNWSENFIPVSVGDEPFGGFTDFYSLSNYPFLGWRGVPEGLGGFTLNTLRVLETARRANVNTHAWIQLYGNSDVWRAPAPNELRFMVFLNLLYGSSYSFFEYKSTNPEAWRAVQRINQEASSLGELFFDNASERVLAPTSDGSFLMSGWRKGDVLYLLVLNVSDTPANYVFRPSASFGANVRTALSVSENRSLPYSEGFQDMMLPYDAKVYRLN